MCYSYKTPGSTDLVPKRSVLMEFPPKLLSGFTFPEAPVTFDTDPDTVSLAKWGLIPSWAKTADIAKNTLNARIETLNEKPSFRSYVRNRCLVHVTSFFEWRWMSPNGNRKEKHEIVLYGNPVFSFAGLYSIRNDIPTFTIVTTEAEELMSAIHNSKKRMPVILTEDTENAWLSGLNVEDFAHPEVDLIAQSAEGLSLSFEEYEGVLKFEYRGEIKRKRYTMNCRGGSPHIHFEDKNGHVASFHYRRTTGEWLYGFNAPVPWPEDFQRALYAAFDVARVRHGW